MKYRIDYVNYYVGEKETFHGMIYKKVLGIWCPLFFKRKVNVVVCRILHK